MIPTPIWDTKLCPCIAIGGLPWVHENATSTQASPNDSYTWRQSDSKFPAFFIFSKPRHGAPRIGYSNSLLKLSIGWISFLEWFLHRFGIPNCVHASQLEAYHEYMKMLPPHEPHSDTWETSWRGGMVIRKTLLNPQIFEFSENIFKQNRLVLEDEERFLCDPCL